MMYNMNRMTGPLESEGRNMQRGSMAARNGNMDNIPTKSVQPPKANPDNIPTIPLPPIVGNPGAENIPVVPLPPIVENPQQPVYTPDYPVKPLPPIVENPQPPVNTPDYPVKPLPPIVENPQPPVVGPGFPVIPLPPIVVNPGQGTQPPVANPGFSMVRFLHAVSDAGPVNVSVGIRTVANNLSFGNLSAYNRIQDGFHSVTVSSSANPNSIIFRGRIPFNTNEKITLAIVKEGNGYNLVRISDQPCQNRPAVRGCLRAVNLIYNSPPMDVIFTDGRIAFPDVRYKEVSFFKQVWPGEYDFYIAQTPYSPTADIIDIDVLNNLPVVLVNFMLPGFGQVEPLVSSYVTVRAGGMYTIYMLGNWQTSSFIQVKVAED